MNLWTHILEAFHESRRRQADVMIHRYRHLVEEAREYDRKCEITAAGNNAGRRSQESFATEMPLCNSQTYTWTLERTDLATRVNRPAAGTAPQTVTITLPMVPRSTASWTAAMSASA
jgi:hypothetical protein